MNIILGAESLFPPLTGIGNYTKAVLSGLRRDPRIGTIHGLQYGAMVDADDLLRNAEVAVPSGGTRRRHIRKTVRSLPGAYRLRSLWVNVAAKRALRRVSGNALYHEPNFILRPFDGCSITNIHDLSHIHYPECHPPERVRYLDRELPKTLRAASHIITGAEFIRQEIIDLLGVDQERITAIPNGVGDEFYPRSRGQYASTLAAYDLQEGYVLSVGTLEPRKNLAGLLRAYMRLPEAVRKRFPLVLVGAQGWRCTQLQKEIETLQRSGQIRYLEYVPFAHLPHLYAAARVFVFPSYYEGFGLPPLEAMASGTAVLTSHTSAMAEVVGNAGMLVDTRDDEQLFEGLRAILEDEGKRQLLQKKGLRRARQLGWRACVEKTVALYFRVAKQYGIQYGRQYEPAPAHTQ